MSSKDKRFTVVGIYADNHQRYATDAYGPTPTDAVIDALLRCREDNQGFVSGFDVCAVFRGSHPCKDVTVSDSRERPEPKRCRAKKWHKYTVVTEYDVKHVKDLSPIEAELGFHGKVAGVFSGHVKNYSDEVDWERVKAETRRKPRPKQAPASSAGAAASQACA